MLFECHSNKQERVLWSKNKYSIAATGIQWGKTTIGVLRLKLAMHKYTNAEDNFLVTSPTFPILVQSTLPPFLNLNEDMGEYNKKDNCFKIDNGGTVWFRTGRDPNSVVGITNIKHILCDEAGLYTRHFWDNIEGRGSFWGAPITIVTSPYNLGWLYTDFIRPYRNGDEYTRQETTLIQAKSIENPYFNKEEYERQKRKMDQRRFNMMFGGDFSKASGLVYHNFDADKRSIAPLNFPNGTRFFAGVDWGYTDPATIVVRALFENGNHYDVAEYCASEKRISELVDEAGRLKRLFDIERFYCDPSRPENIDEFNAHGLGAVAAENAIIAGIDYHFELIQTKRYKIFNSLKNCLTEYEMYHYPDPKDLRPDQDSKDQLPVDANNHCMDAIRYVSMGIKYLDKTKRKEKRNRKSDVKVYKPYDDELKKLMKKKKEYNYYA